MMPSSFAQTELMKSRTSSASRLCAKEVKPEKSAKSTVTCFRSVELTVASFWAGAREASTGLPQLGQKRAATGKSAPQHKQRAATSTPHFGHTCKDEETSVPHAGQNMTGRISGMRAQKTEKMRWLAQ